MVHHHSDSPVHFTALTIDKRFNGPATTGNGGYSAGIFAETAGLFTPNAAGERAATIALKAPPPLGQPLVVLSDGVEKYLIDTKQNKRMICSGHKETELAGCQLPVKLNNCTADHDHTIKEGPQSFGYCFVCGQERDWPEALCIYCHPVIDQPHMVMAKWALHDGLLDEDQFIAPRYLVSALDCPGYYASAGGQPALLGKITVEILHDLPVDADITILSWATDTYGGAYLGDQALLEGRKQPKGRKRYATTALVGADGKIYAYSYALWVIVSEDYLKEIAS